MRSRGASPIQELASSRQPRHQLADLAVQVLRVLLHHHLEVLRRLGTIDLEPLDMPQDTVEHVVVRRSPFWISRALSAAAHPARNRASAAVRGCSSPAISMLVRRF